MTITPTLHDPVQPIRITFRVLTFIKNFWEKGQEKVIHPFLLAVFPIIHLVAANIDKKILFSDFIRPVWNSLVFSLVLFIVLKVVLRDWHKAGVITSLILFLYYFYGHVYFTIAGWSLFGFTFGRADTLAAAWSAIFILSTYWIIRILKDARPLSYYLNIVTVLVTIWPGSQVCFYFLKSALEQHTLAILPGIDQPLVQSANPVSVKPDIYYIILDGFGRSDVLSRIYREDNQPFIEALKSRGFDVAQGSYANYPDSVYSISSSLNFSYLDKMAGEFDGQKDDFLILHDIINTSPLLDFLRGQGYSIIAVEDDYGFTQMESADRLIPVSSKSNYFEYVLEGTTLSVLWKDNANTITQIVGKPILEQFKILDTINSEPSPKFVYAHILAPHPPFVFDENGSLIPATGIKSTGWIFVGERQEYIQGYTKQIRFVSQRILRVIDEILQNSTTAPIIILQGDHGPDAFIRSSTGICYQERMAILNAYYFPAGLAKPFFYDSISPVNSFRMVLNAVFHTQLPFLEDRSFMPTGSGYTFQDITEIVSTCDVQP